MSPTSAINARQRVRCWGLNDFGQSTVPMQFSFEAAIFCAAGAYHTCCLDEDHLVLCWGMDDGWGDFSTTGQVSAAPKEIRFSQLALGSRTSCGLVLDAEDPSANGTALCWGSDDNDEIEGIPAGVQFTKLSGGGAIGSVFCGLDTASRARCCFCV